jgi:phage tail sheath gpL-like
MSASIPLQGVSITDPQPGNFLEIDFAVGQPAGTGVRRPIMLLGNPTTAGSATADTVVYGPDTPVSCQSEPDVIALFGAGSELHRMFRRVAKICQAVSVYFVAVAASAGASAALTFTFLNVPTAAGTVTIYGDDESVDTSFPANPANLGVVTAALVTSVNARTHWAFTAAQATVSTSNDSVRLTAKIPGPRGNLHRGMARITLGNGGTSNMTVTNTSDAAFSGGTTADSNVTALATIQPRKDYYLVSAAEDATQFGALATQVTSNAQPATGNRQRCFTGSSDTLSNAITLATGINNPRAEIAWLQTSPVVPSEIAAIHAANYAQYENSSAKPRCNFNGLGNGANDVYPMVRPRVAANVPIPSSIKSALLNGLSPVGVNASGSTYLVKRITSRSLSGANNDYRIRDAHKVTVCDFFGDDLLDKLGTQFANKNLADDPPAGSPPPDGDTTTPLRIKDAVFTLVSDYGETPGSNLLVNTDQIKAGTIVQREKANRTRVSILIPLQTVDILDTTATLAQQIA